MFLDFVRTDLHWSFDVLISEIIVVRICL
jgi:hypothetical protein